MERKWVTKWSSGNGNAVSSLHLLVSHPGEASEHVLVPSTRQLHMQTLLLKSSKEDELAAFTVRVLVNLPAFISFPPDCAIHKLVSSPSWSGLV